MKIFECSKWSGAVLTERFSKTVERKLRKPVFKNGDAKWIDVFPSLTKKCNKTFHTAKKVTSVKLSLKKNEKEVLEILKDKRQRPKPTFKVGIFVRTADKTKIFSEGEATN